MNINFLALLLAAISTLAVGFIWYHPKVFGTIWMKESGVTEQTMKGSNMIVIFQPELKNLIQRANLGSSRNKSLRQTRTLAACGWRGLSR